MPQPVVTDVHVDMFLSNILLAYMNEPGAYIADILFPQIPVMKQSNLVATYKKDFWFRDIAQQRAPATESTGSGFEVGKDNYFAINFATHVNIPDEVRENQDNPYNVDAAAVALVDQRMKLRREIDWAEKFFKTGVWQAPGSDTAVAVKWDTYASSNPITDIDFWKEAIHSTTAREATDLTIGRSTWRVLRNHPDILERIKYTQTAIVSTQLVATLMELRRVNIGRALQMTAAEGATDARIKAGFSYIFGRHALLSFVPQSPGEMIPAAGYTFLWTKMGLPAYIRFIRDDKALYDRVEGQMYYDQKGLGYDLGYLAPSVIAGTLPTT